MKSIDFDTFEELRWKKKDKILNFVGKSMLWSAEPTYLYISKDEQVLAYWTLYWHTRTGQSVLFHGKIPSKEALINLIEWTGIN